MVSLYARSPLFTLNVPRSKGLLGSLLVVAGLAILGTTFAHRFVGLASFSMLASLILLREFSIWRSGEGRKMFPPVWSLPTTTALLSGFLYLFLLGLVIDGDVFHQLSSIA
jgi:hypothetical protein